MICKVALITIRIDCQNLFFIRINLGIKYSKIRDFYQQNE